MSTPLDQLLRAARLLRASSDEMRAEMAAHPDQWSGGYRFNVDGALGGPAGKLASRWDPATVAAVATMLEQEAQVYEVQGPAAQHFLAGDDGGDADPAIVLARAYLGEAL